MDWLGVAVFTVTGTLLAIVGIGLLNGNWISLATVALLWLALTVWRIRIEENALMIALDGRVPRLRRPAQAPRPARLVTSYPNAHSPVCCQCPAGDRAFICRFNAVSVHSAPGDIGPLMVCSFLAARTS